MYHCIHYPVKNFLSLEQDVARDGLDSGYSIVLIYFLTICKSGNRIRTVENLKLTIEATIGLVELVIFCAVNHTPPMDAALEDGK